MNFRNNLKKNNKFFNFKNNLQIDIQILRGFSVILVLFYHFNFDFIKINIFKAGYIGVDIFFIISGYIITRIICEGKNFNLINFYKKRIKRLFPALLTVLLASIVISIYIFKPFILKKNIESINSILIAASNVYFWLTSTLYGFAEKNNLLFLHTWSLAIEIQFYLFYPVLFIIFQKKTIKYILIIFTILSYLSVTYLYQRHPIFNFFSSFGRIFEITIGCLTFFYYEKIREVIKKNLYSYFYLSGFFLIIFFMFFLQKQSNHPDPFSILFVLGVSLMIIFFNKDLEILYKLKLQYFGSISYSLYLWHFPIIVLFNYYFERFDDFLKIIALLISIIVSYISFHYIENKFRITSFVNNLIYITIMLICLILITNYYNNKTFDSKTIESDNSYLAEQSNIFLENKNKYSWRKSKNIFSFKNDYKNFSPMFTSKNNKKILFIGDSFSKDIFNVFYVHKNFYNNYEFARYGINLIDINSKRLDYLLLSETFKRAEIIYISSRYKENEIYLLENWISLLKKYNKKIIIQLKKPEFKNTDEIEIIFNKFLEANEINAYELNNYAYKNLDLPNFIKINEKIIENYQDKVILFDLFEIICSGLDKTCNMINDNYQKNFYDYGHFTIAGSKFFGQKIIDNEVYKNLF